MIEERSLKPYAPTGVLFDDTSAGDGSGRVRVTWNNRNRLTSGIKRRDAAGDALEDGQTHTIRIYAHDGTTLLHTETGLTGEEYEYLASDEIADAGGIQLSLTMKFKSVRDGYESYELTKRMTNRLTYVIDGTDDVVEGADSVVA